MSSSSAQRTPDPMRSWWREVYYHDFAALQKRTALDFKRNEIVWVELEPAAWVYELAHHFQAAGGYTAELPGYGSWPAFPELNVLHRVSLTDVVDQALGFRPVVRPPPPPGHPPKPGYSRAFPGYSWDLHADDKPLVDGFLTWIQSQRQALRIQKSKGKKQFASHNKRELPRKLDWRFVEVLDHKKGRGEPLSEAMRTKAKEARDYAWRFLEPVRMTVRLADEELRTVTQNLFKAYRPLLDAGDENVDVDQLKTLLGQFETVLFGRAIEGSTPTLTASDTPGARKLKEIIRRFRECH